MEIKTETYINQIYNRMTSQETQTVFVISDFCDLMDYGTAKKSLSRLEASQKIQRIIRGVYYIQGDNPLNVDEVAKAIARNFKWTIAPGGNAALNELGLCEEEPVMWLYFSTGPYKTYRIGNRQLKFKHKTNNEFFEMSSKTNLVIQALKELGETRVTESVMKQLKQQLTDEEKSRLLEESKQTATWIYNIIKKIASV